MSDQRTFGDVGNKKVYENDRVCVWELRLEPGEESPVHRHGLDHILIQIAGDRIALAPEPDTASRYKDYMEAEVLPEQPGQVRGKRRILGSARSEFDLRVEAARDRIIGRFVDAQK